MELPRGLGVSSVTAREKAIEAGLKAAEDDPRWKFDIYPTGWGEVEDILTIAAPHIESALLDRIEAAVKRLRDEETSGPDVGDHGTYGTIYGLDAVLATLTELREEGK